MNSGCEKVLYFIVLWLHLKLKVHFWQMVLVAWMHNDKGA